MRRVLFTVFMLAFGLWFGEVGAEGAEKLIDAQQATVMVTQGDNHGTGVLFKNGESTFVWTAAHVLGDARHVKTVIDPATGKPVVRITYDDVFVTVDVHEGGRKVGEDRRMARIIRISKTEDIALLAIYQKNYGASSTSFAKDVPEVGEQIWHVGSMHGWRGAGSVSEGVLAATGRLRNGGVANQFEQGKVFDQVSITAHPGSSGGGVFRKSDGQCLGLIIEFLDFRETPTFGSLCIFPARRIYEFAKDNKVPFAIDASLKVPAIETILATPITVGDIPVPADFPIDKPKKDGPIDALLPVPSKPKIITIPGILLCPVFPFSPMFAAGSLEFLVK